MANLKVRLVSRVTNPEGKRSWVAATAASHPAPLYLLYYSGSRPVYEKTADNWEDAEIAKMRAEKRLRIESVGGIAPSETATSIRKRLPIAEVIDAYITEISKPDKNGDFRPEKSINSTKSELTKFRVWSKKVYLDEITRQLLVTWRDELNQDYEPDTVVNKLMTVATFFKHNPLAPQPSPLPASEFPDKKVTIPDPYTEEEFNAFMAKADYETGLLVYFFATTGMREQEVAHTEREDVDWNLGNLHIVKKAKYGFTGKTRAALRTVPLDDELLAELRHKGSGLFFPNASGHVHTKFLRDVIAPLAKAAGVTPTTEKPHMKSAGMVKNDWLHRFRDTYITNQLHRCKTIADLMDLCKRVGHSDTKTLEKYYGKLKKPYTPKLRLRKAKKVTEMKRTA